jgi:polysaccharide export outer membrane protein
VNEVPPIHRVRAHRFIRSSVAALCRVLLLLAAARGVAQSAPAPLGGVSGQMATPSSGSATPASDTAVQGRQTERAENVLTSLPDKPTEFQEMVLETTGRQLPIFGASLFQNVPSTFAPVADVPDSADYVIGPGDELRVQIFGQVNQTATLTVDRGGDVSLPQVGPVHLAGMRFSQVQGFLKDQLGKVYRNFELNVSLGRLRSIQVFVVGQAHRPGSYTVSSLSTLLNALFASGGPLPQGSLRDIQVQRGSRTVVHFDLYDLLLRGDKTKDIPLATGDVIFIPVVGAQAAVVGSVNNPSIYELPAGARAQDAIAVAGGLTIAAAEDRVRLERVFEHTMRSVVDLNLPKGQNPLLQNGDILTVPAIVDRFRETVTMRGNVANPGRYAWHAGMRVADLIPSRDALITRNYFRKRNELGQAGPQLIVPEQGTEGSLQVRGNAATSSADAVTQRGQPAGNQGGNSLGAALTSSNSVFQAKTDVVLSAPDINWSYAVIERQDAVTLKTSLIPFALGKVVLDGDQAENRELLAGDVVTIFSTSDLRVATAQQTRFVRLEGEFIASGVYSVQPGETLRQLLKRAGGFTPDAFLYASEFTRESTKRVQRQRLNEYADTLDAQVASVAATGNARAINDRDAAASMQSLTDSRLAIARLRQLEPIGRIVLPVKPESRDIDSLPDLALEDGDRFVVPRVPSVVSVEGRVYSANAFVFEQAKHTADYLRMAGGPDRQADRKRSFVLRADGSVFSNQYGKVTSAEIYPGDTIVVPPILDRRAVLRNLLDISNIVGQFGLGAAAIQVLR